MKKFQKVHFPRCSLNTSLILQILWKIKRSLKVFSRSTQYLSRVIDDEKTIELVYMTVIFRYQMKCR